MTRLGREIATFREVWYSLPEADRVNHENQIRAACASLKMVTDTLPEVVADAFMEAAGVTFIEAATAVGSGADKVRLALAEGFPEMWQVIAPLLTGASE